MMLSRIHGHLVGGGGTRAPLEPSSPPSSSHTAAPADAPVLAPEPRLEDLLRPEALAEFDREKFERDGFWLWSSALTDAGRERMTGNLQRLQAMQDYMVLETDWAAGIDWGRRGLPPPPPDRVTHEWRQSRVCGGSEQLSYYPATAEMLEVGKGFLTMPTRGYMSEEGLFGSGADSLATDGWPSQGHVRISIELAAFSTENRAKYRLFQ